MQVQLWQRHKSLAIKRPSGQKCRGVERTRAVNGIPFRTATPFYWQKYIINIFPCQDYRYSKYVDFL